MGVMRFYCPRLADVASDAAARAFATGHEEIPWPSWNAWNGDELIVRINSDESCVFHIPWYVDGHGEFMLRTTSLMQRQRPYRLPLELARGTLSRIRNHVAQWASVGLKPSDQVLEQIAAVNSLFIRAATSQYDEADAGDGTARRCIAAGLDVIELLIRDYVGVAIRRQKCAEQRPPKLLAGRLDADLPSDHDAIQFAATFNGALVPMNWGSVASTDDEMNWESCDRRIDWCQRHGLRICAGPLVSLQRRHVPGWVTADKPDVEHFQSCLLNYVDSAVRRYRGKVHLWHSSSRLNVLSQLSLREEDRLRLAVSTIEVIRNVDDQTPVIISIDQPWGEYLSRQPSDLSPLELADALIRADLRLSAIGLEINLGFVPGGTENRDLLEFSCQLDRWGLLGLPLVIFLALPGGEPTDPALADSQPIIFGGPKVTTTWKWQQKMVQQLVPLFLSNPFVHGVFWSRLCDNPSSEFPDAGLFDEHGLPKPAFDALRQMRETYLSQ